ncbi:unnamed protein product [Ixodes persulcatus]
MNFSLLLFSVRRFTNMHSLRESQVSTPNRVFAFQEFCSMRICGLKSIKDFLSSSWYLAYFLSQLIYRQITSRQMRFARVSTDLTSTRSTGNLGVHASVTDVVVYFYLLSCVPGGDAFVFWYCLVFFFLFQVSHD